MPAVTFEKAHKAELDSIEAKRKAKGKTEVPDQGKRAWDMGLLGVGFSGGGIRSATFNLGVLQGLAEHGLLDKIDYLSTVSGGGYLGAWLHGVIKRKSLSGAKHVLHPERKPGPVSEDPITWLRKFSNYLAPQTGAFSKDTWTLGSLWLRNFVLNQLVMLPVVMAILLVPVLLGKLQSGGYTELRWYAAAAALLTAVVSAGIKVREIAIRELEPEEKSNPSKFPLDAGVAGLSVVAASIFLGWAVAEPLTWSQPNQSIALGILFTLFTVLQIWGGFPKCYELQHKGGKERAYALTVLFSLICTAVTAGLIVLSFNLFAGKTGVDVLAWVPPLLVGSILTGVVLLIGLMGADYPDACREWLSRTGAVILMSTTGWCVLFGIGFYIPSLVTTWWRTALTSGVGWITTTGIGLWAASSSQTGKDKGEGGSSVMEKVASAAPLIFILGYLVMASMGVQALLAKVQGQETTPLQLLYWIAGLAAAGFLLGTRVNINEFSIHHLYKNRLVRCYLGASKKDRQPNPWTGFDGKDDLKLVELSHKKGYEGPYAIINTAVNINSGSELATQSRKAASFFMTPDYCGFVPKMSEAASEEDRTGFIATENFMPGGPGVGTAVAISGAAANPNMGYHTSGPIAFLLTVFNIRLGWWVGNPIHGESVSRSTGPWSALKYMGMELLGLTTARTMYLNLSDGGHFENLGLYELMRRRCKYIIIGDGEQDGALAFGSLAEAIRRCQADFGYQIEIDFERIRKRQVHAVVGKIVYEPGQEAKLLYIKSSLTGDEPEDIREFQSRFPDFPHQSTGDQFFDEAQFESYRRLGLHVARGVLARMPKPEEGVDKLFDALEERWYAPSNVDGEVATRLANAYSELSTRLSKDPDLAHLDAIFLPGAAVKETTDANAQRKGKYFCIECIQLMENVYTDFNFENDDEWNNPSNGGWHKVFVSWGNLKPITDAWAEVKDTYNIRFQRFFLRLAEEKRVQGKGAGK